MIQFEITLSSSLFITCLLTAIFLTLFCAKKDSIRFLFGLLCVGAMALLSLSQTLKLIFI
jgi:hypothetical protein